MEGKWKRAPNGPRFHVAGPDSVSYDVPMPISAPKPQDITVTGRVTAQFAEILTPEALDFIAKLHRQFEPRRQELLLQRAARQRAFDAGRLPDFLPETRQGREDDWKIAAQPKDMLDRRVQSTGPTHRQVWINTLNSGASTFLADFDEH